MSVVQRNETMRIGGQKVSGDAGSLEVFNPYKNGISSYDIAYLSSKRILKNKTIHLQSDFTREDFAA